MKIIACSIGRAVRDRILHQVAERMPGGCHHASGASYRSISGTTRPLPVRAQPARAATQVGFRFEQQTWPPDISQEECKARLVAMNDDADVLGSFSSARCLSHSRPLACLRDPPVQGHRGHESRLDRQHCLQRPGAGAVHGGRVRRVDSRRRPRAARPRGRQRSAIPRSSESRPRSC